MKIILQAIIFGLAFSLGMICSTKHWNLFPQQMKEARAMMSPQYKIPVTAIQESQSCILPVEEKTKPKPKLVKVQRATKSQQKYIDRFWKVAQAEQQNFGIPASISLAQGLLESRAGQSKLAKKHNNHFGIKCFKRKCSTNHCQNFFSDHHKDFFRKYENAWASWRDHSKFLSGKRYRHLKKNGTNYYKWAKGLKKAGYAADPNYATKLIQLIEDLELHRFDNLE